MTTGAAPVGVVLMAYGTPRDPSELLAYYTDIRRGRPPTEEQLAELGARYAAIGGVSPLRRHTDAQRDAIQGALDELEPGRYNVAVGLKHADPSIESAVGELAGRGAERIVGLVLAPHNSALSIGQYVERARTAGASAGVGVVAIETWATEPALIAFLANDVDRRLRASTVATHVVFTAHSLPERILATGDPYPSELRSTAEAAAGRLGLVEGADWSIAWQSAGRTPEPWIGPDVLAVIDELAGRGCRRTVVCACGFVADHLEVLYDLDIEARARAERHGMAFERTASVNADADVMRALARRIVEAA